MLTKHRLAAGLERAASLNSTSGHRNDEDEQTAILFIHPERYGFRGSPQPLYSRLVEVTAAGVLELP